jgi:NADH-quinone oxidoreductase subunit K
MVITVNHYLVLSLILFTIGMIGVIVRRNAIVILMSLELMFNAAGINLVAFAKAMEQFSGQVFAIFIITIAAGEAAVGLAIIIAMFRNKQTVQVDEVSIMKW